jgi:DNA repair photolyase
MGEYRRVERLVGIARMAAQSVPLEQKRATTYLEIAARSYITKTASDRVPFRWMINPYRGCEFGCKYCYARYTHQFMELHDPFAFEHQIFAKHFVPEVFRKELRRLPVGETVAIGTATDPYQPAERRYEITRRMLEEIIRTNGLKFGITTKSDLIARDVELLKEVSRRHFLTIAMTITSVDVELARKIEPLAPRPDLRLRTVHTLSDAAIRVFVHCAPVMPLINDSVTQLRALALAARDAGAAGMGANPLFLKPSAWAVFIPFLEERFPTLVRRYRERYEHSAYLRGVYPETVHQRVQAIARELWPERKPRPEPELWPRTMQLNLFV